MSLKGIAKETLRISDEGRYVVAGVEVDISSAQQNAVSGTTVVTPDECAELRERLRSNAGGHAASTAEVTVANETTQAAAQRFSADGKVTLLDFASAKNVAGGFLNGAKAQEEDLARCSGLFRCLEAARAYYDANRACDSMLYTDHVVVSPDVPFFRVDGRRLLPSPFPATVLTAPAPNAGQHRRKSADLDAAEREIADTLQRRVRNVVAIAASREAENLVLGAWGCGVFMNDPVDVARAFHTVLVEEGAAQLFRHVHFAVYDRAERGTCKAFIDVFAESRAPSASP